MQCSVSSNPVKVKTPQLQNALCSAHMHGLLLPPLCAGERRPAMHKLTLRGNILSSNVNIQLNEAMSLVAVATKSPCQPPPRRVQHAHPPHAGRPCHACQLRRSDRAQHVPVVRISISSGGGGGGGGDGWRPVLSSC
jgi:hypothetical protein